MKFTEEKLEKAFTELLEQEGYPHHLGSSINRKPEDVLIEEDIKKYLLSRYDTYGITINEVDSIIPQLKTLPASDIYERNKTFLKMLSDGFILKREDRTQKDIYIQLLDYSGLNKHKQPDLSADKAREEKLLSIVAESKEEYGNENNIYKFVTQLEIVGDEKRIPDGIVYINGLPVAQAIAKNQNLQKSLPTRTHGQRMQQK